MRVTRIVLSLVLVVLGILGMALNVAAQGPAGTWATGIQVQNQAEAASGQGARVTFRFYWKVGACTVDCPTPGSPALEWTDPTDIPAGQSKVYYVPTQIPGLPENFVGSAVVTSDGAPIAAILNTSRVVSTGEKTRIGSAIGVSEEGGLIPAAMVYAPYLRKNYYGRNSYVAVQNTTDVAANVTLKYYDAVTGAEIPAAQETASIPAFSNQIFYQDANAGLPDGFFGSAVIDGNGTLLAVVANNANSGNDADVTTAAFESYNGFIGGATKVYVPKATVNYYNYQTGLSIQNIGTGPADVTVTFNIGGATYTTSKTGQAANTPWSIYLGTQSASGIPTGTSGSGSAIIESTQPIVVLVSEVKTAEGFGVTWGGFAEGSGSSAILFPKFDRTYYGYNGGIQIQNLGDEACDITATWSQQGRTDVPDTKYDVQPGESIFWYGPNVPGLTENFSGSVVVVSSNGEPIAGVYTSRSDAPVGSQYYRSGDSYSAYNGIAK
ncbi:MAG: hypothetical protein JXA74_02160 [Anaerolineae bacterium]|nr:hypothetical protein [Anaerolineae bacterium]